MHLTMHSACLQLLKCFRCATWRAPSRAPKPTATIQHIHEHTGSNLMREFGDEQLLWKRMQKTKVCTGRWLLAHHQAGRLAGCSAAIVHH